MSNFSQVCMSFERITEAKHDKKSAIHTTVHNLVFVFSLARLFARSETMRMPPVEWCSEMKKKKTAIEKWRREKRDGTEATERVKRHNIVSAGNVSMGTNFQFCFIVRLGMHKIPAKTFQKLNSRYFDRV